MSGLDLYQTQRALALLFVYATAVGFCLGGVYDALRILRLLCGYPTGQGRRSVLSAVCLFAEDVLFMLIAAVALILLCYYGNDGQIRAPAVIGVVCGFFVYRQTVGRLVMAVAERLTRLIRKVLAYILHLLVMPIRWFWRMTAGRLMATHRERMTQKRIRALTESAAHGFDLIPGDPAEKRDPPA